MIIIEHLEPLTEDLWECRLTKDGTVFSFEVVVSRSDFGIQLLDFRGLTREERWQFTNLAEFLPFLKTFGAFRNGEHVSLPIHVE